MNRPWTYESRLLKDIENDALPDLNYQKSLMNIQLGNNDNSKRIVNSIYNPASYKEAIRKIPNLAVYRGWLKYGLTYERYREAFYEAWDIHAYGSLYYTIAQHIPKNTDLEKIWKVE